VKILGLNHGEFNSSAALIQDARLCYAAPEERFTREKRTKNFPSSSIGFILNEAGIQLTDLDAIAQGWNPSAHQATFNQLWSKHRIRREDYFYTIPDNLLNHATRIDSNYTKMEFDNKKLPPIYFVDHHLSHAANAYFTSSFDQCAILTADWRGEETTSFMGVGSGTSIRELSRLKIPDSIGLFYATYTQMLGYKPNNDEWKVMALSAYDLNADDLIRKIKSTVKLNDDGYFELDRKYYIGFDVNTPNLYSQALLDLLGYTPTQYSPEPSELDILIAIAMQNVAEMIAINSINYLNRQTGLDKIVLGGGFFMNSVLNGKIAEKSNFKEVYLPPAPADVGNSVGSAFYVAHCINNEPRVKQKNIAYLGPSFSNDEVEASLKRRRIDFTVLTNMEKEVATILAGQNVVAFFQGPMEFGERALGNRSILSDPRFTETKDLINSMIKFRESYRPFAPVCITEEANVYFDLGSSSEIPFMEKVVYARPGYVEKFKAVVHVDNSARLQTVSQESNPLLHNLLIEYKKISGFPVLLNTSFNINGEPIVCTPDDALNTFFNSGLTHLVIGNFLVEKSNLQRK
jgi:carbamoyltransferase